MPASDLSSGHLARVDRLLEELLDMAAELRAAALEKQCADDPAVRREVESLLNATYAVGGFMAAPAMLCAELMVDEAVSGARIGAWRVISRIGRGGMGVVYEAERAAGDFRQRAAIKVLRQEAVAELPRFHVERQILARLEHPGIARLLDGGITADERPYMVMEFVEGQPITQYCREVRVSLAERLGLF